VDRPLDGLRVLDLSQRIAGAYATKLLADAGADVLKLEPPGGDPLRRWSASHAPLGPDQDGALFQFLCTSKRSALADLEQPGGRERARGAAARADVVIESFEPGEIERLGLGPEALARLNPRTSLVSISSYGRGGPHSGRAASEFTLQAQCGTTASRGLPEQPPLAAGGRLGEWLGGLFAAIAALVAWRRAARTGRGEHVDLSLLEAMSTSLNFFEYLKAALTDDFEGYLRREFGRALEVPSIEPARDGYVGFALFTAQMWQDFAKLVERPDLAADRELGFMLARWPRRAEIHAAIHPWLRRHDVAEVIARAAPLGIPVAPIGNGATIPQMEHFRAVGSLVRNPGGGFVQPRVPYRISGAAPRPFEPAPRRGQHDAELDAALAAPPPAPAPTAPAAPPDAALPLAGLHVADFTQFIAGPTVTHLLAALGADVVKIESVQRPDGIRFASSQPPTRERWWEYSWVFHGLNANKRSITLDLSRPEGRELASALVARADLVVENFAPHVMDGFGLGWAEIARLNPRAIFVRMPAFGLEGPWRDRAGLAQTMEQISGMAQLTGFRDGPPVVPRGPCDAFAGLHACFAALAALALRERSGRGQRVESIMVEGALNIAAEQIVEYSAYGRLLERDGNRDPVYAPQDLYACAGVERWLALSICSRAQWCALRDWLERPAWAADPSLERADARRAAREHIDAELARVFASCELEATVAALAARGIPAAPVVASPLVLRDSQHRARGFFEALDHPVAGAQEYPRLPWRSSAGPARFARTPPPLLGEHNDAVLGDELGVSAERLAELRAARVVGERPANF
jgi:crotonobetainyl-CoA:carnitine CoA-transferase CaiB-like acyl-CoA transferase